MEVREYGERSKRAAARMACLATEEKNRALLAAAESLSAHTAEILSANRQDMEAGRENGLSEGLLDRLKLTEERIQGLEKGLRDLAALPDPVGEVISDRTLPNGLRITKRRVTLGVIGII